MDGAAILARVTEELIAHYGDSSFETELRAARDAYCERRGRVFEDDEQWESFTRGFLEWYVVERPWRDSGVAPARLAAAEEGDSEKAAAMVSLFSSQRCLAQVESLTSSGLEIVDLVGGAGFAVEEARSLVGMQPGDVLELRVIGFQGHVCLGRTFLFHPPGTVSAICDLIDLMRGEGRSRADIIDHMASLRSRSRSYRHVSPIRIYESNGLLDGTP